MFQPKSVESVKCLIGAGIGLSVVFQVEYEPVLDGYAAVSKLGKIWFPPGYKCLKPLAIVVIKEQPHGVLWILLLLSLKSKCFRSIEQLKR